MQSPDGLRILEYAGLDFSRVEAQYRKTCSAIARGDFRSADVKKLTGRAPSAGVAAAGTLSAGGAAATPLYRAKLDHTNRLLFTLVQHGGQTCALMLEVIHQHAYDKSRFLRGAAIDEDKIPLIETLPPAAEAVPLRYLHPQRHALQFLDRPLSFDDVQEAVYRAPAPLVIVGAAGSGKTALTLEKMKHAGGEVLYVTHSAYLAQSARALYYAEGFARDGQDATFLSYREFIESLRVPPGREALWRDFSAWFTRQSQAFKGVDGHQAFEEIRGVLLAAPGGVLSREAYVGLGVRQSIFPALQRSTLYDLYERYRAWLAEARLYDLGLLAQEWLPLAAPHYDFVVVDEVQDLTPAQLLLVLRTLKKPGGFMLCGDSNQIVHPNFFSWSQVKTLFWRDPALAAREQLHVLRANFRNGIEATRAANTLLKIKHRRFGSVDRESNFLVDAAGAEAGTVALLADQDAVRRELNQSTRQSARCAVLVLRDEDKMAARQHFQTPLVFSIHEAKGLEYDSIVLYRFVSGQRAEFAEIAAGVSAADLAGDELTYRRARDKDDKSLEVYKFYVNALYVALTRAIRNVYLVESDTGHPLLQLLGLHLGGGKLLVEATTSSREDWQNEARRLEMQGKQEQADAIHASILKELPVPWPVFGEARLRELLVKVLQEGVPGSKPRQQLFEYATCYHEPVLARRLGAAGGYDTARNYDAQRNTLGRKHYSSYFAKNTREILQHCDRHGIEHRTPMNQTPLIAAAAAGNLALVEALLMRGANPDATDHMGQNALHWALREAFRDKAFAQGPFPALYERIAPATLDLMAGGRLVRLERHLSEYFLFQTLWVLFRPAFTAYAFMGRGGFDSGAILTAWSHLPASVLRAERKRRPHLSGVLARNETGRDYAYNRHLFKRIGHGWYQFNSALALRLRERDTETWQPVYAALNLPLVRELADPDHWPLAQSLWQAGGGSALPAPLTQHLEDAAVAEMRAHHESVRALPRTPLVRYRPAEPAPFALEADTEAAAKRPAPPWGTPAAKQAEIERLRQEQALRRSARGEVDT